MRSWTHSPPLDPPTPSPLKTKALVASPTAVRPPTGGADPLLPCSWAHDTTAVVRCARRSAPAWPCGALPSALWPRAMRTADAVGRRQGAQARPPAAHGRGMARAHAHGTPPVACTSALWAEGPLGPSLAPDKAPRAFFMRPLWKVQVVPERAPAVVVVGYRSEGPGTQSMGPKEEVARSAGGQDPRTFLFAVDQHVACALAACIVRVTCWCTFVVWEHKSAEQCRSGV